MNNRRDASASSDYWPDLHLDDDDLQNVLDVPLSSQNKSQLRTGKQHTGFDNNVGDTWLYPSNLPQRAYQMSIAKASLFNNTLVVLPTGLGKTFIAAVVMYNIYRWYPTSKIIFMAPTRPLVAQQINACQRVMPFPDEDTIELTGRLPRTRRKELWNKKRVFFATPQVVQSDICEGDDSRTSAVDLGFPFDQVKLIVVDEAHRAKGRYAYTEVVQAIKRRNGYFRVLALSATPGRTMEDIAEIVCNLLISHIEVRCDTSIDVLPYVHKRHMKTIVVPLGEDLKTIREEVLEIIDPYLRQLVDAKVLGGSLTKITRNFLLYEQKRFRDQSRSKQHPEQRAVSTNFSFCISMYHALELLERHGLRVFLNYFEEDEEGRSKFVVNMEPRIRRVLDRLRDQLGPNPFEFSTHAMTNGQIAKLPDNLDFGHPKFEEARTCLLEHFQALPDSRAIVFCEYRESVMLIYRLLLQHVPLLKPRYFVGQGGTSGSLRPLTQKEQLRIMQDFRSGKNNILVATSIGEEGLDVGEVELIVCFDINTSNPQRFVQRIGRTGRRKQGNVVILVTEGREQQILKGVLEQKDQTNAKILQSMIVRKSLYKHSSRLVPTELDPKVVQVFIKPLSTRNDTLESKTSKESKLKKLNKKIQEKYCKSTQDLRSFFKQKTVPHPGLVLTEHSQQGLKTQQNIEKCLSKIDEYFNAFEAPVATNTQLYTTNRSPEQSTLNESHGASILDTKRFRNLQKLLQKNRPLVRTKDLISDPIEQLKSSKVSNDGKRFILRACPSIVRDALEKIKILESLALEPDEMTAEEKDVRHLYSIIENVLGGSRLAIELFVDDADIEQMVKKHSYIPSGLPDVSDSKYKEACDAIFEGLEDQGLLCDNFDYIQEELKKTDFYKESYPEHKEDDNVPMKNAMESMIYETFNLDEDVQISSMVDNSTVSESIYQSHCRWDDFTKNASSANKSTPLQGPLVKAFQRQLTKSKKTNRTMGCNFVKKLDNSCDKLSQVVDDDLEVIFLSETEAPTYTTAELTHGVHVEQDTCFGEQSKNPKPKSTILNSDDYYDKSAKLTDTSCIEKFPSTNSFLSELDISMEAFLEPFPEETASEKISETGNASIQKTKLDNEENSIGRSAKPILPLYSIQKEHENIPNFINAKRNSKVMNSNRPAIPSVKPPAQTEQCDKSQNPYETNLQNVQKCSSLPECIEGDVSCTDNHALKECITNEINSIPEYNACGVEKLSIILPKASKRKLIPPCDFRSLDMKADEGFETECEESQETQIFNQFQAVQSKVRKILPVNEADVATTSKTGIGDGGISKPTSSLSSSQKENENTSNLLTPQKISKELSNTTETSSAKPNSTVLISNRPVTPPMRLPTQLKHYERSPNLYEMYLQNVRKRRNLPEYIKQSVSFAENRLKILSSSVASESNMTLTAIGSDEEELFIIPAKNKRSKPKFVASSDSCELDRTAHEGSETECEEFEETQIAKTLKSNIKGSEIDPAKVRKAEDDSETNCEEIPETQKLKRHRRFRRQSRRLHGFLDSEAIFSGDDESEEEYSELPCSQYVKDSMIVSSDEPETFDENAPTATQMQAFYLQSVKSPKNASRNAFKIPAFREFNDRNQVYSQPAPVEPSHYVCDSFVVNEDDEGSTEPQNQAMCPLERAERILKERRRARKKFREVAKIQRRRRICQPTDSSDDGD